MRDAVSLLDQMLSIGAKKLSLELLEQVLPRPGDEQVCEMVDKFIASDAAGALAVLDGIISSGHALESLVVSLMEHLRGMMLLRICGPQTELVDAGDALRNTMVEQAKAFDEPVYVFMLSMLEELRRSVRYSGTGRSLVEAVIVRLCMLDAFTSLQTVAQAAGGQGTAPQAARSGLPSRAAQPPGRTGPAKKADSPSSAEAAGAGDDALPPPAVAAPRESSPAVAPVAEATPASPASETTSAADLVAARQKLAETRGLAPRQPNGESSQVPPPRRPQATDARTPAPDSRDPLPVTRPSSPVPRNPLSVSRGTSSQDIKKVTGNSMVRRAIELFEGTLVGVRPLMPATPETTPQGAAAGPAEFTPEADTDDEDDG